MRKMKFKSSLDLISYDEFIQIFYDFQKIKNASFDGLKADG